MTQKTRRLERLFYCLISAIALLALPARAAEPNKTIIDDTIYRADGTPARGTILISWPAFSTADGKPVAAGTLSVKINANGSVNVPLIPTQGATPTGTAYKVVLSLDDGATSTEYWAVPALSPTTIAAIRSAQVPATVAMQVVSREYVDGQLATAVRKNGDEAIDGVKNFAKSPLVPSPGTEAAAANKGYVDVAIAAAAPSASNVLSIGKGGTGTGSFTPARCVRVSADGSQLEAAAGDCNSDADTVDGKHAANLSTTLDVRDFGADPNGVNDSTAAINAAINAARNAAHGATLAWPEGIYKISQPLAWSPLHNVSLRGQGRGTAPGGPADKGVVLKWTGAAGATMLQIKGGYDWQMLDLTLDCNNSAAMALDITADPASGPNAFGRIDRVGAVNCTGANSMHVGSTTMQVSDMRIQDFYTRNGGGVMQEGSQTVGVVYDGLTSQLNLQGGGAMMAHADIAAVTGRPAIRVGAAQYFYADDIYVEADDTAVVFDPDTSISNHSYELSGLSILWRGPTGGNVISVRQSCALALNSLWVRSFNTPNTGRVYVNPASGGMVFLHEVNTMLANSPAMISRSYTNVIGFKGPSYPEGEPARFLMNGSTNPVLFEGLPSGGVTNYVLQTRQADGLAGPILAVFGNAWWQFLNSAGEMRARIDTQSGDMVVTGRLGAGGAVTGGPGDVTAARSSTQGVTYLGSDGARYLYGHSSTLDVGGMDLNLEQGRCLRIGAVSWCSAAGAPSGSCTTGSLYSRTDGGSNSTLYVCANSSWIAK